MDKPLLSGNPQSTARTRKQMRKGTHSCIECRRRKTRCIFSPGATVCSLCSARGKPCVQQGEETPSGRPRERSESSSTLLNAVQADPFNQVANNDEKDGSSDGDIADYSDSNRAPLVSFIANSQGWSADDGPRTVIAQLPTPGGETISTSRHEDVATRAPSASQLFQRKSKDICRVIRSALPGYDSMITTLQDNGSWWGSFRFKTHYNVPEPAEDLLTFAARCYTSNSPALLGTLAVAYARCLNGYHSLYATVETLVVSDFEYTSSLDGMQCLCLLAKSLTEIGHPRRSWRVWRKGLADAQLMGMYRCLPGQALANNLWWLIYYGDRFSSLLLGVPHGFNDDYFDKTITAPDSPHEQLVRQTITIAGKIIDRNVKAGKPSIAHTLSLDEQLEAAAVKVPQKWWDVVDDPAQATPSDKLRETVLLQLYFFYIRAHLHLPFMAKSATAPSSIICKLSCIEASRQLLRRFLLFRSPIGSQNCLLDCKTTSFISFIAAVILAMGLDDVKGMPAAAKLGDDMETLRAVKNIFQQDKNTGCRITSQCCDALDLLMGSHSNNSSDSQSNEKGEKILIPYFGLIVRRRPIQSLESAVGNTQPITRDDQTNPYSRGQQPDTSVQARDFPMDWEPQLFEYTGLPPTGSMFGFMGMMEDANAFDGFGDATMYNDLLLDLEQDWNLFSNFDGV